MSSAIQKFLKKAQDAVAGLRTEQSVLKKLDRDTRAALKRLTTKNPELKTQLAEARGYAVFPIIGEAALLAGGAFGKGEVFEQSGLIGYAAVVQATVGLQMGGGTVSEIIVFQTGQS